ncbi:GDSL-type esterase/lipase family protein [Paenibacillus pinistramenti]|uniref:GDSL-type esterase/lipase family protein n=1 Tax=Paenibacillus pinistramenti TaxID=1768003 RepID=UPI00110920B1|nr:GDSL-type esterase/lipase family protein [Paenibacillus pinistramenti]
MQKLIRKLVFFVALAALTALPIEGATSEVPNYMKNKSYIMQMANQSHYKVKHADIVMLGDSITFNVQWNELLGRNVANRGIGGDFTAGMLNRLDYVTDLTPYMVFIMAGINDLNVGGVTAEEAFSNYTRILERLEEEQITPAITLTLYVGKEVKNYKAVNQRVQKLNSYLITYANAHKISYIDLNPILSPDGYLLSNYSIDGIHINGDGYLIWGNKINELIDQVLDSSDHASS